MNTTKWSQIIRNSRQMLVPAHADAIAAGLIDPVMILIDPREGSARRFAQANLGHDGASDTIDELISSTHDQQTPLLQITMERERLATILPPNVQLWNVDHERQFVVVF